VLARTAWILFSGLLLAGCYGSTDPAGELGSETARLNAHGTADNGAAASRFEYWVTGTSQVNRTEDRHWPAGASGPISEKVARLYAGRAYSFRICGKDDSASAFACANTRTFTTAAPVQDSAVGQWGSSPHFTGSVNAHSGPSGQSATGTLSYRLSFSAFAGKVTCLRVGGNRATVGGVGELPGSPGASETMLLTVVDNGPSVPDTVGGAIQQGSSTPPSCAAGSFDGQLTLGQPGPYSEDIVVNDAP